MYAFVCDRLIICLTVHVHFSYRDDDASGLALSLRRELAQLAPDITLTSGPVRAGERPQAVPRDANMLMLIGTRWMRPASNEAPYFDDANDPMRLVIEAAIKDSIKIVPVLFQVPLTSWGTLCRELPASLGSLAQVNAFEIRSQSFANDLRGLLNWLRLPDRIVPWTETGARALIRIEAEGGGALKWWSNRNIALRVLVDNAEVGGLAGWDGRFDTTVEPGRHTVQIREGPIFKCKAVIVDVALGATISLVCGRNIFTGRVSLKHKG